MAFVSVCGATSAAVAAGIAACAATPGSRWPPAGAIVRRTLPIATDASGWRSNVKRTPRKRAARTSWVERWPSESRRSPARCAPLPARSTPAPGTVGMGQTKEQVVAVLGQPERIADFGTRQIYFYKNLKVTFNNGKVAYLQ